MTTFDPILRKIARLNSTRLELRKLAARAEAGNDTAEARDLNEQCNVLFREEQRLKADYRRLQEPSMVASREGE